MAIRLGDLAADTGAELRGDPERMVNGVAPLDAAGPDQLTFLASAPFRRHLADTRAAAVILRPEDADDCPVAALVCEHPYAVYARCARRLHPAPAFEPGVHPSALVEAGAEVDPAAWIGPLSVVERGARIAAGVYVGPGCVIEADARIGEDSRLVGRVVVCHGVVIGRRAMLLQGAVIGAEGFGLARADEGWLRIPQVGTVRMGDDVEVGANTTIDRGALQDTVIGDGVKLDNQIQIAHNVRIGAHTVIAGCTGIAGSAVIGARCMIGGGVGISGHIEIADDVQLTGMTFVTRSIREPGVYSSGMPAETNQEWRRGVARYRRLDELAKRIKGLERRLKADK